MSLASDSFEGPRRKLARGKYHLDDLKNEVDDFVTRASYRVTSEEDQVADEKRYRVHMRAQPPAHLSSIIGDCVNNLRSALDQAVSAVARHMGTPDTRTYFPTCDNSAQWRRFQARFIGLGTHALSVVDGLQPYHQPDPDRDLLGVLTKLWNLDKHRDIILTGTCVSGSWHKHAPARLVPMLTLGTIQDGDVIMRHPLSGAADFESGFAFAVAFGHGNPAPIVGGSVVTILGLALDYVTDRVLPALNGLVL